MIASGTVMDIGDHTVEVIANPETKIDGRLAGYREHPFGPDEEQDRIAD